MFETLQGTRTEQEKAEAVLAIRRLLGEGPRPSPAHYSKIDYNKIDDDKTEGEKWEASLDALIPPSLLEKSLPFLALFAVIVGCFLLTVSEAAAYGTMMFDPIFVVLYLYLRTERRRRAKEMGHNDSRLWFTNLNALLRSL